MEEVINPLFGKSSSAANSFLFSIKQIKHHILFMGDQNEKESKYEI